jgi:hypothetical protein
MNKKKYPAERCAEGVRLASMAPFAPRVRIPHVMVHPVLSGDRNYLRTLRAAEMAAWEASLPLELAKSFAETVASTDQEDVDDRLHSHSFGTFV